MFQKKYLQEAEPFQISVLKVYGKKTFRQKGNLIILVQAGNCSKNAANLNEVPCALTNDWQLLGKHSAFSTHLKTELTPATAIREMNFQAVLC